MKNRPSMKKPQLDPEDEALKFAAGATAGGNADADGQAAAGKHHGHKEAAQNEPSMGSIRVRETGGGHGTIQAEGSMTIYEAAQLKPLMLEALQKHQHIEIDLSEVAEMDTAGMQLLLLLKRTANRTGKSVALVAHSPASLDVIDRYNLGGYFGDPVVISSVSS